MLIGTKTKEGCLEKGCVTGGPEIMEASELLYGILNASYQCSGTYLEREINGNRKTILTIYWECKDLMERAAKGSEKTEFLIMSILEQTFRQAYPLLLVRLEDVAEGDDSQIRAVQRLKQIFKDNPFKAIWREKSEKYRELLEKLGFSIRETDYADLTAIMDPLLDAFTLYQGKNHGYPPKIHKVRTGVRSSRQPEIGSAVCKYRSEKELVDEVAGCGKESVIVFGAVEKTNRQVTDYFHQWYYERVEERQENTMRHDHINAEEYMNQVYDHSRCVYLCVKSGETIWLMRMPYQTDTYSRYDGPESKYYHGCRAGYAPYEIFYKEPSAAPAETTFLAVPRKGYLLSELMDEQQKIWFPVFVEETIAKFFRAKEDPAADKWVMPEEATAVIPGYGGKKTGAIVPVFTDLPAVPQYTYTLRSPEEIFDAPYMRELCHYFQIRREDILDVPILPSECGTPEVYEEMIGKNLKKAYSRVLAGKIADFLEGKWKVRGIILDRIAADKGRIIEEAAKGKYSSFMSIVVDGTPVTDKDGKPAMRRKNSWSMETSPIIIRTTSEECRESIHIRRNAAPRVLWAGDIPSGKAPVVWKLRPRKAGEYSLLLDIPEKELPEILRLSDAISWFYKEYENVLPADIKSEYIYCGEESEKTHSVYLPPLGNVNICMTKRTYKKYVGKQGA